jgi:D-3-phosphoglycerate dehydrogenase
MSKILIDRPLHKEALQYLAEHAEVIEIYDDNRENIVTALKEVDGAICSAALKMRKEEIALGRNLKVIGRPGVGYDSVDIEAATAAGIPVVYAPDGPTESVAEHVIAMMLMLAKKINIVEKTFRHKGDFGIRTRVTGMELQGKTLGLIGAGRIGKRTSEIAGSGLGMHILIYDPYVTIDSTTVTWNFTQVNNVKTLLEKADVVSVHIPLTAKTRNFIGAEEFHLMKKTAFFINTARGGVIDEAALIRALDEGAIAGAGLDVFEKEPTDPDNPLLFMENTVVTPHMSSFTDEGKRKMGVTVVQGTLDVLAGKYPECIVNPEVWEKRRT